MKKKIIEFVKLLGKHLYYISFHNPAISIIYPICIIIVLLFMLYTKIVLAYDFNMAAISAIKLLIKELLVFFTINIVLFTVDYPFSILRKRNEKLKIEKALTNLKVEFYTEKEKIIEREREAGRQVGLKENQEIYEKSISTIVNEKNEEIKKLENEKNDVSQRLENEIFSDEYKSFKKANEENIKFYKVYEKTHNEKVEIAIKYALIDLDFLKFKGDEIMFISNTIRTFVNTRIIPNDKEFKSPITNRYKIKSNKHTIIITTYELGHFSSNLAKYLNIDLKDVVKLCTYIFSCEEGEDSIIYKAAKKKREEDRIKLIENLEEYVKSKSQKTLNK